ncbi:MAG: hypothetical protein RMM17_05520 [Acidobacteriota bacterium]|nr:hypothetical protein [Blastocatellia bacterium]MDW8412124.1 hypothetical protein [Acidobacteriota bacterium]
MKLLLMLSLLLVAVPQNLQKDNALSFDKPKQQQSIPNPYVVSYPKDVVVERLAGYFKDSQMQLDTTFTRKEEGFLVTKPFVFVKGTLTRSQLDRFGSCPAAEKRNWTRARATFQITVEATAPDQSRITVSSKLEGLSQELTGSSWVSCKSNGQMELQILEQILESLK